MKKFLLTIITLSMLLTLFACGQQSNAEEPEDSTLGTLTANSIVNTAVPASDVPADAWYAEAVRYCVTEGLIDGTSSAAFSPNAFASRGVLVTALYRHAGSPLVQQPSSFIDISTETSYSNAAAWASENDIVSGYGDGRFGGEDPVTREQFAAMLWRMENQPVTDAAEAFADQDKISAYAVNAVAWARSAGIVSGKGNNLFDPQANITRGEVAAMLYRWLNPVGESLPYDGVYPQHEPYGTGIGAMPGRVVWAHDPDSVDWDGDGYWWQLDNFDEAVIRRMVDDSIASLGGKDSARDGWAALFQAHNGGVGYTSGEKNRHQSQHQRLRGHGR